MNNFKSIKELREKEETKHAGLPWSEEEEKELFTEIKTMTFSEIALKHKRTEGAIKSRLTDIAVRLIEVQNKTIEYASKRVKIPVEEIQARQARKKSKDTDTDSPREILIKIRDLINKLIEVI